jgi:toxin ParE1/3/4
LSVEATHFELTPQALADLEIIWRYSAETWSIGQADRYIDSLTQGFETLVAMPSLARERSEFSPPMRLHPHGRHLIIYHLTGQAVIIIRVLGAGQDWQALLTALE